MSTVNPIRVGDRVTIGDGHRILTVTTIWVHGAEVFAELVDPRARITATSKVARLRVVDAA